jgi:MYXO-CTERM domain-containing protein
MHLDPLAALALAFPILAAAAAPGVAQACPGYYGPCQGYEFWQDLATLNATKIPSDGVLMLQGTHQGDDAASLPTIELTVTKDGQPLAGALEATSIHGVLVWRPAGDWEAGATYALAGTVTNVPNNDGCGPPMIVIEDTLTIDVAPGAAIGAVDFVGESVVQSYPQASLSTLACCEGATPSVGYSGCGGPDVYWDPAECAPTQAHGYLTVQITGEPAAAGPVAVQIEYSLMVNGNLHSISSVPQFSVTSDAPFCALIEAKDLASGVVTMGQKHCFGDAVVDQLGPQVLDPTQTLQCALVQCMTASSTGTWDPMMCTPYDPDMPPTTSASDSGGGEGSETAGAGEGDKGCGCDAGPGGDAGLLALIGVVGLARRRRRR